MIYLIALAASITGASVPDSPTMSVRYLKQSSLEVTIDNQSSASWGFVNDSYFFHITVFNRDNRKIFDSDEAMKAFFESHKQFDYAKPDPLSRVVLRPGNLMRFSFPLTLQANVFSKSSYAIVKYSDSRLVNDPYNPNDEGDTAFPFDFIKTIPSLTVKVNLHSRS
jgi:hypothetical protein